jgi:hypothetical protein
MVVVDKLTKASHCVPVKLTHKETNIIHIYMKEIVMLHDVPKSIMFDRDPKFTLKFWRFIQGIWDKSKLQYNISPRDRWEARENQSSD